MQVLLGYYGAHHPFLDWAVANLIPDHRVLYYTLLYTSDVALLLLMSLPFAIAMHHFLPHAPWKYIGTAVTIVFLWEYRVVWADYALVLDFLANPRAYIGIMITVGLLPVSYLLSAKLRARYAT